MNEADHIRAVNQRIAEANVRANAWLDRERLHVVQEARAPSWHTYTAAGWTWQWAARPVAHPAAAAVPRTLTPVQLTALQTVMRLFVEEDLGRGIGPTQVRYCSACHSYRPMAGFIQYGTHAVCNRCATAYEIARLRGVVATIDQHLQRTPRGQRPARSRQFRSGDKVVRLKLRRRRRYRDVVNGSSIARAKVRAN
jgi:hypothetical protein